MTTEAFDPIESARLLAVTAALYQQLSPEDLERAMRAEAGSTRLHPMPLDGWWRITVGTEDVVDLGDFHISVLRRDTNAGSAN